MQGPGVGIYNRKINLSLSKIDSFHHLLDEALDYIEGHLPNYFLYNDVSPIREIYMSNWLVYGKNKPLKGVNLKL